MAIRENPIDLSHVTLAILAGGEGTRMGFPKQNLEVAGEPILNYLVDRFAWTGPTLLVTASGRSRPPEAELFGDEAVDTVAGQGPLRGVLTALQHAKTEFLLITTVDMPGLENAQLRWLIGRFLARPALHGLMLRRTDDEATWTEPFPFVCRREIAPVIAERLAAGRRSVHSLAELRGFAVESAPMDWTPASWTNLNYPEDYRSFVQSLSSMTPTFGPPPSRSPGTDK